MKITTKFLEEMLTEMNAEFDLDFKISGKHSIFCRKTKENIAFDSNSDIFNYLCGMRRAFWMIRNNHLTTVK